MILSGSVKPEVEGTLENPGNRVPKGQGRKAETLRQKDRINLYPFEFLQGRNYSGSFCLKRAVRYHVLF